MRSTGIGFLLAASLVLLLTLLSGRVAYASVVHILIDQKLVDSGGTALSSYVFHAVRTAESRKSSFLVVEINAVSPRLALVDNVVKSLSTTPVRTVAFISGNCNGPLLCVALACDSAYASFGASVSPFIADDEQSYILPSTTPAWKELQDHLLYIASTVRRPWSGTPFFSAGTELIMVTLEKGTDEYLRSEGIMHSVDPNTGEVHVVLDTNQLSELQMEIPGLIKDVKHSGLETPLSELKGTTELRASAMFDGFFSDVTSALRVLETDSDLPPDPPLNPGWRPVFARVVANPIVLSLLVTLGFLALLIELKTPGVFLGAGVFVLIFTIFFYANFVIGTTSGWEILLFLFGVLFLGVEIVAMPGFGLIGILGIVMIVYSLFASLVPGFLPFYSVSPYDSYYEGMSRAGSASLVLLSGFTLSVIGGIIIGRFLPDLPFFGALVHTAEPERSSYNTLNEQALPLVGKTGVAVTDLHPAGKILVDGRTIEARSSSGFIPKGRQIKVIASDFGAVVEEF